VDQFRDGVWLVELDQVSDTMGVRYAALYALDLREEPGRSPLDTLNNYLRDREILLILDNCEHLVNEAARFADSLLRTAPTLRILATSREPLGIYGETAWRIPSLALPDPGGGGLDDVRRSPAVRLFVDRARAARPSFDLTQKSAVSVAHVCRRLDGIPLAIELAAARARVLSVEQIAERLDDRFRLLTGGSRTALPRQQTLRALIDWSYDLLRPDEQLVLRRLAVFSDGWTLEAAESVCAGFSPNGLNIGSADVLDYLESLVDKSLVLQPDESFAEPRYRMLESVRHYAAERLDESGERNVVRDRHQEWFVECARRVYDGIVTDDVARWIGRAYEERENLWSAIAWRAVSAEVQTNSLRIIGYLQRFWGARHGLEIHRRIVTDTMALAESAPRDETTARALYSTGFLFYSVEEMQDARVWCESALEVFTEIGADRGRSDVLNVLGLIAWKQGRYGDARALYDESLVIRRAIGSQRGIAAGLNNLAILANEQGDNVTATSLLTEALQIQRETGDRETVATSMNNLGVAARDEGDFARARSYFEQALEVYHEVQLDYGILLSHGNLGLLSLLEGDVDQAFRLMARAALDWDSFGNRSAVLEQVQHLARVWAVLGDVARAATIFGAVASLSRQITLVSSPFERRLHESWASELIESMPADEWRRLFAEGQQLSLDEAVALATER
jgi:predicted ATPase/Flp pilus assembly protein TadD